MGGSSILGMVFEGTPELLGLDVGRVVDWNGSSLGDYVFSSVGSLGSSESWVL